MKLFLDDYRDLQDAFYITGLPDYFESDWVIVRNYNEFTKFINENGLPTFISFDHDLSDCHYGSVDNDEIDYSSFIEKTGYDCAKWLCDYCLENNVKFPEYRVHSLNYVGKENIIMYIENFKKHFKK